VQQLAILNPENATDAEISVYPTRESARAIVADADGNIALLYVSKKGYFKLPGGGIESGEDKASALSRECIEEIGCDIKVLSEVGTIIEYRKIFQLKQVSYCYLATVKGEKGEPQLTESELEDGFEVVWQPYDRVLEMLRTSQAIDLEGKAYIVPRDIIFLEASKQLD
jgi:8-oxo-dGTP pyrophosphatase MutT (NUDIX family)